MKRQSKGLKSGRRGKILEDEVKEKQRLLRNARSRRHYAKRKIQAQNEGNSTECQASNQTDQSSWDSDEMKPELYKNNVVIDSNVVDSAVVHSMFAESDVDE